MADIKPVIEYKGKTFLDPVGYLAGIRVYKSSICIINGIKALNPNSSFRTADVERSIQKLPKKYPLQPKAVGSLLSKLHISGFLDMKEKGLYSFKLMEAVPLKAFKNVSLVEGLNPVQKSEYEYEKDGFLILDPIKLGKDYRCNNEILFLVAGSIRSMDPTKGFSVDDVFKNLPHSDFDVTLDSVKTLIARMWRANIILRSPTMNVRRVEYRHIILNEVTADPLPIITQPKTELEKIWEELSYIRKQLNNVLKQLHVEAI